MHGDSRSDTSLPLGSDEELQWRLSCVRPSETTLGVFIKGVLESVRQLGHEDVVQACLEASGEKSLLDFFSYPQGILLKVAYTAARLLSSRYGSFDEALRRMGYQAAKTFYESTPGKAILVLNKNNPQRILENLPATARTAWKDIEVSARMTGLKSGLFIFKHDLMPRPYNEGGLQATFEAAKIKGVKVVSRSIGPLDNEYEIFWE